MKELLDYLASIRPGAVSDAAELEVLLAQCWHEFCGSDEEEMAGHKLLQRMQDVEWSSPRLHFWIERHGGTMLGSSRAERQGWTLDTNAKTATCGIIGYKQVSPMAPRLDVRPLAEEVVQLILHHKQDERLKWNDDGSVRIHIGTIIPEFLVVKQTLAGRRKRFRQVTDELLGQAGWPRIRPNVYGPPTV